MAQAGKHTYNDKSPVLWAITFSIDYGQKNPFPFTFMKSTVGQAVHEAHTIIICMLGNFFMLFRLLIFFQNQLFRKKSFRNTIKVSNSFDLDQTRRSVSIYRKLIANGVGSLQIGLYFWGHKYEF